MAYDFVIRDATLVSSEGCTVGDLAVADGRIAELGTVTGHTRRDIDGKGLHLMPGFIDTQVHFREPGLTHKEDLESGTRSAACGGVTTILEMPNTDPTTSTADALSDKLERAVGRSWCDFGFFVGATADNVPELPELEMSAGTPGIKVFVGSSTGSLLVDEPSDLERVLAAGIRPCALHSEHEARLKQRSSLASIPGKVDEHNFLRDAEAAVQSTALILELAARTKRHVHILHISTADEVPMLAAAKAAGQLVSAEVTPQHLYFAAPSCYAELGALAQMNPPIREEYHRRALWRGLEQNVFDCFGSDHAPHTLDEKALPYRSSPGSPSGMPGVQTILPVLLRFVQEGRLSLEKLVLMGCERPAALYGIAGKGSLNVGNDADLCLIDFAATQKLSRWDIQSKCGWSPYEGHTIGGFPKAVFVRGNMVSANGKPSGEPIGRQALYTWKQTIGNRL